MKVFVACGAYDPVNKIHEEHAKVLGDLIGKNGFTYVQGGNGKGMMGLSYHEFLKYSDDVEFVVPEVYNFDDVKSLQCKKTYLTKSINERLQIISQICDYFVVLPGGTGTIDEITNFLSTNKGKEHQSKIILLNSDGFFNGYLAQIRLMEAEGFIPFGEFEKYVRVVKSPEKAIRIIKGEDPFIKESN